MGGYKMCNICRVAASFNKCVNARIAAQCWTSALRAPARYTKRYVARQRGLLANP